MKKISFLKVIVFFLFFVLMFSVKSYASVKKQGIENFPDSYKPYLYELKKNHPNWEFSALYTGFDWNYVISQEYRNNKNLVPLSYSDYWKCTDSGIYNIEIDKGWVNASKKAIEYTMDPRNFLNEVRIFQFEKLSYDPNINSKEGVEKILYGTEFYNKFVSYKTSSGSNLVMNSRYSDLIWNAAIYSGVSPYHLASRIKQEVGPFITHSSISGTVSGYEGLYNFYNIGATSSAEPMGAIRNGLQFAKDGKGASENVKQNLFIPWTNPDRAIKGGAVFIGKSYISVGQNTLYLQKFDVNNDREGELFWHQYMTNCLAPYSESSGIHKAYSSNGVLSSSIGFLIPVYENMPKYTTQSPNILESDYIDDNKKVYADVTTTLNVRSGPSTSYEKITSITRNDKLVRLKRGIQSGERWDKVELENGIVGYVFQSYIKERVDEEPQPEVPQEPQIPNEPDEPKEEYYKVTEITLSKEEAQLFIGENIKIIANVLPENATDKTIKWSSQDSQIVSVSDDGTITAKSIGQTEIIVKNKEEDVEAKCIVIVKQKDEGIILEFSNTLRVEADEISKIDIDKNTVNEVKELINTNLNIEIYNKDNKLLNDTDKIGTGSKLILKNDEGSEVYKYTFIVYGDVNGDGVINSLDVLVLQKHILETKQIDGIFLKAGNISKNGNLPSSLDVLKIQKHILETKFIEQ